jgi:hypothetical protein
LKIAHSTQASRIRLKKKAISTGWNSPTMIAPEVLGGAEGLTVRLDDEERDSLLMEGGL